jgi:Skp family chaperone for outer membrane proteins
MRPVLGRAAVILAAAIVLSSAANLIFARNEMPTGGTRVGVVDLVAIFNDFQQTKVLNQKMQEHRNQLGQEADRRMQEINAKRAALAGFTPDTPDWFKRNEELKKMRFDYRVWEAFEEEELAEHHLRWIRRTYDAVTDEIADVARQHGVHLVVTREELDTPPNTDTKTMVEALFRQILARKVVYSEPAIDLSQVVLANLNGKFERAGGARTVDPTK